MHTILLVLLAVSASTPKTADVAHLVNEKDATAIVEPLRNALHSTDPLTRSAAARVIAVRDLKPLVADTRAALDGETDATAAREEIRTVALVGGDDDIEHAISAASRRPASVDNDLAIAIARRGGLDAINWYFSKLNALRTVSREDFFRIALWGRPQAATFTASRLVGARDERGWASYLKLMEDSKLQVTPSVLAASLDSSSEPIRVESVWHIVRSYAIDPSLLPQVIRDAIAKERDAGSLREDFGRDLIHRMAGLATKDSNRYDDWLESPEADALLGHAGDAVYNLLSEREFAARHNRCGMLPSQCDMPARKVVRPNRMTSKEVGPAAFQLPGELPAGLAGAVVRCRGSWLGLLRVAVDTSGRVQTIEPAPNTSFGGCLNDIETLVRLSYATNTSVLSPLAMPDVIVVHADRDTLCLDEDPPSNEAAPALSRSGGRVMAPVKIRSVDPVFPDSARQALSQGPSRNSIVILEAVITKSGCIRSVRPILQSPIAQINSSAIFAISQWKFSPGRLDGKPVDVIYNLTIDYKLR